MLDSQIPHYSGCLWSRSFFSSHQCLPATWFSEPSRDIKQLIGLTSIGRQRCTHRYSRSVHTLLVLWFSCFSLSYYPALVQRVRPNHKFSRNPKLVPEKTFRVMY